MKSLDRNIVVTLLLMCSMLSLMEIYVNLQGDVISDTTSILWAFVFALLVAIWVTKDRKKSEFDAPFEFSFVMYLFWPVMLPYYLTQTRGVEGMVVFLGFVAIYLFPFFSGLVAYVYFT